MMRRSFKRKNLSQSILEYIVVIIVITAALVAIAAYYKRSLQGKYRQAGDVFGQGSQYTP
ncbi:MAG: hypothetical protein NTW13_04940 [Candidatus Omnitrophica bacterium]|nr:hypothetical protein [Candidatus Omnitrophota bacterium]